MKRLTILSALSAILLIGLPIAVLAHDGGDNEGRRGGDEDQQRIEIRSSEEADEVAEEDANSSQATFEIRGMVTEVNGDTFMIAGQTITVDPTLVTEFEQEGTLSLGSMVKVEGVIQSGVMLAEEIKVE